MARTYLYLILIALGLSFLFYFMPNIFNNRGDGLILMIAGGAAYSLYKANKERRKKLILPLTIVVVLITSYLIYSLIVVAILDKEIAGFPVTISALYRVVSRWLLSEWRWGILLGLIGLMAIPVRKKSRSARRGSSAKMDSSTRMDEKKKGGV